MGLAIARGVGGRGLKKIDQCADGERCKFGGLDAGAGDGGALDEGELVLDVGEFEPAGDDGDGDVELGGDLGEREA
ncbi:MAG: hypothetical protein KF757_12870 [Phycisphaeraceae bacterium]|nr:hypothetical protein [Phycisphaeraceae bacterium]